MPEIIASRRGSMTIMLGQRGLPGVVSIDGFEPLAAIIDAPSMRQRVNVQFQTALEQSVYAYVFGDHMGSLSLQGTAFAARCNDESANGLKEVLDFYNQRRASQNKSLVVVTFGEQQISGFMTELQVSAKDPLHMLMNYGFIINALPKKGGGQ